MTRAPIAALGILAALLAPSLASADLYLGAHPVDLDGGWHEGGDAHEHEGLVVGDAPFGEVDGVRVFLADPVAYGYRGSVWTYRGSHPVPGVEAYCAIDGEHAHPFAPDGAFRREPDGVHVHVGALRGGRAMLRPSRMAPAEPIVTRTVVAPFWFGGCLQRFDVSGQILPLFGCRPYRAFVPTPTYRAPAASPSPAPAPRPPRFPTRPVRGSRAPPSRGQ